MLDKNTTLDHLRYTKWATARTLETAADLSSDEATRDLGVSFGSVLGTLIHTFCADRMWLSRIEGKGRSSMLDPGEELSLGALQERWPALHDRWLQVAAGRSDVSIGEDVVYQRTNSEDQRTPYWQVILHLVNHASYHRGQVASMLRQLGRIPLNTDLVTYYRSQNK